jgi:lysine 6-dehydrogenase
MKFLVLGAGKMGFAMAYDLIRSPRIKQVIIADHSESKLELLEERLSDDKIQTVKVDVSKHADVVNAMAGCSVAISCAPYYYNYVLAKAAVEAQVSFCDFGGNKQIVEKEFLLDVAAKERNITIIPDTGLTPGLISIAAVAAAESLNELYDIKIRVGGVPVDPEGLLMSYCHDLALDVLIDEYTEDVTVIRNGEIKRIPALTELESLDFPKPFQVMEAFTTAGGISTLPQTFLGKVQHLDYKTIRYPGHCQQIKLLRDLGLMSVDDLILTGGSVKPRDVLTNLLDKNLKKNEPDAVLVRVTVSGIKKKHPIEVVWECIDYADQANSLSAMMRMTAFPASIIAQMIARGDIQTRGVLRPETCVPVKLFLTELASRGINFTIAERLPAASATAAP